MIRKLNDCKTLDDFNEFSKRVQVNGKSAGRSFTYVDLEKGRKCSYSMNQIVHQLDKCIKNSKKSALNNLCADVNEAINSIDQWNSVADKRTNTSLLLPRKWLGNGWYFLTHLGMNKNKTLTKIRAAYPKALANLPQLPSEIIDLISLALKSYANQSDSVAFAGVNKASYARYLENEAENDALIKKYGILGRKQWQAFGVEIGNAPPLPEGIEEIMESDCPFIADKKVMDTHALIMMPETINGELLTLKSIGTFIEKTFGDYCDIPDSLLANIKNNATKSYWLLMTKEPIPRSFNKNYLIQEALVADHSSDSLVNYEVPLVVEALVFAVAQLLINQDTGLFHHYFTHCQETIQPRSSHKVKVGTFFSWVAIKMQLSNLYSSDSHLGVAACRKF